MLKKFSTEEVSAQNQVKESVKRRFRQSIADEYPGLELVLEDLMPKKSPLVVAKCQNHLNLVLVNNPEIMKKLQVDRGTIKFVLSGANIMCPGVTSLGRTLDEEDYLLRVKAINEGIGVDNMHCLNDGL